RLRLAGFPWLAEAVPAYDSIALQADFAATVPPSVMAARALELLEDWRPGRRKARTVRIPVVYGGPEGPDLEEAAARSGLTPGEHTSELQSRENLVCRLLLEKKRQMHRFWFCRNA